jgi:ketosteroid isomerase-like protein
MRVLPLILFAAFVSGCASCPRHGKMGAKKAVVAMINAIDTKNWKVALDQFDETVFVDYSSMTGQAGSETKAADLVGGWEKLLAKAETHHMLTNFVVSKKEDRAEVISHVYASHTAKGVDYWDIYGRYHHQLKKTSQGWKITSMKLLVHGQKGNLKFLQQVGR